MLPSMRKFPRMPHAPSAPPPELAEFLSHFHVHFAQQRSRATLARYLSGLLTEHPNKNCDTLAAVVQGTNEQQLHHLLTEMVWDEVDLNRQRVQVMRRLRTEGTVKLLERNKKVFLVGVITCHFYAACGSPVTSLQIAKACARRVR